MSTSSADRAIVAASAAVAAAAVVARVHDAVAFPAIHDFDAAGHAVNVLDILRGHLSHPRSWCGTHPPLYYALGALAWAVVPDAVPVHVTLRLLSVAAWVATVGLVWRSLRRLASDADAAVVSALLLGVPGFVIASVMMTNDPLCALLVTATVVRLHEAPGDGPLPLRHVAVTALLAALAAVTKATGMAAVGIAALFYAWRARRSPAQALASLAVVVVVSAAIAGPHYVRLFASLPGSTYAVLAARMGAREKEAISAVVVAASPTPLLYGSWAGLLHAAIWGDPTAVYLPREPRLPQQSLATAGVVVLALAIVGAIRVLRDRERRRRSGAALLFGAAYALALAPHARFAPSIVLTKVNYLMPEALPLGIVLAAGAGALRGAAATALRTALLLVAAAGIAVTWYGWWAPAPPAPGAIVADRASDGSASAAVDRWFDDRARDPIRALARLAPTADLAHELRLARILRVPVEPERDLGPDGERALELDRARVAWLELYNLVGWMQPMAAALAVRRLDASDGGDAAAVRVRVGAAGAAPPPGSSGMGRWPFREFEQRFALARDGTGWRITRIEQDGVADDDAVQAFVAAPTQAGLDRLRALGWEPPWDRAIAAVLQRRP